MRMITCRNMLTLLCIAVFIGCSTPTKQPYSREDEFADIIRKSMQATASRNMSSFEIHSLNILKIDKVARNTVDSQLLRKVADRVELCNTMADLYASMGKINARMGALSKKMKRKNLQDVVPDDVLDDADKAQLYRDSAKYYAVLLDSMSQIKFYNNSKQTADTLYRVRTFVRTTEKRDNDSVNYSGAKSFFITKDKKALELSEHDLMEAGNSFIPVNE